jgi:hypothetical protein
MRGGRRKHGVSRGCSIECRSAYTKRTLGVQVCATTAEGAKALLRRGVAQNPTPDGLGLSSSSDPAMRK